MQIDIPEFERLLAGIRSDQAAVTGFNAQIRTQEARVNELSRELTIAESDLRQRPLTRPSPQQAMPDSMQRRQALVDDAHKAYDAAVAELAACNAQADEVHRRLGLRRRRVSACREIAARWGVTLPGEPSGPSQARIPPQPPARQFGTPAAVAAVARRA